MWRAKDNSPTSVAPSWWRPTVVLPTVLALAVAGLLVASSAEHSRRDVEASCSTLETLNTASPSTATVVDCPDDLYLDAPVGSQLARWIGRAPEMRTEVLAYLVECALSPDQRVWLRYGDRLSVLADGLANLGPGFITGSMSTAEQEKVTSCMLARINAAGQHVELDLIAPYQGFRQPSDPQTFNFREAVYFGNIFTAEPEAYVWLPGRVEVRGCTPVGDCGILEPTGLIAKRVYPKRHDIDAGTQCYVGHLGSELPREQALRWGSDALVPLRYCTVGSTGARYNHVMTVLLQSGTDSAPTGPLR